VAVVTGLLFFAALFERPRRCDPGRCHFARAHHRGHPDVATVGEIRWTEPAVGIPAFLTMLAYHLLSALPMARLRLHFIHHPAGFCGQTRRVNWLVYVLTLLFIARFVY